jgi:hypothetical protein
VTECNLRRLAEIVRRAPTKHNAATIGLKIGKVINKHKMAKHFTLDIRDDHFSFERNEAAIASRRATGRLLCGAHERAEEGDWCKSDSRSV